MKNVLVRLNEYQGQMTPAESSVVRYILKNPEQVVELSIRELAEHTFSSTATAVRLCRRLGFAGYKELKRALQYELTVRKLSEQEKRGKVTREDSLESMVDKVTYKNIASLEETRSLVELPALQQCIDLLCGARLICLFGIGTSLCVARDAYMKFLRLGCPCILSDDWHLQLLQSRNMTSADVGLFISYSGQTPEMVECAKAVKETGASMILITRFAVSALSELADCNLYVAASEPLFRSGSMSSRISQLNMIDILCTAYVNANYENSMERLCATYIEKPNYKNGKREDTYIGTE